MKRTLVIALIFSLLFSVLCLSSCRIGPEEWNCHGLLSNDIINVPYCTFRIVASSCNLLCKDCGDGVTYNGDYSYRDITKEDFKLQELSVVKNSDGIGSNGYITVKTTFFVGEDISNIVYLSYKVNVYDGGELVGNAIITVDTYGYKDYESNTFTKITNVKVERYISGNYTLELEYITGKVYN